VSSAVVFIHLGRAVPAYTRDAICQAALFSTGSVYLVAERAALADFGADFGAGLVPGSESRFTPVACEDLGLSEVHQAFRAICPFDKDFRGGFWNHATERFFYLATLAEKFHLDNLVHLENDVMLYADIDLLTAKLAKLFPCVAAPFDNDDRCIPGIVFSRTPKALKDLCGFITDFLRKNPDASLNDMVLLAKARQDKKIDALPILPPFYEGPLRNALGKSTNEPALYTRFASELSFAFDAAAIGQYLGGGDPRNLRPFPRPWYLFFSLKPPEMVATAPGFINESCLFDPSTFTYEWVRDAKGRLVPFMVRGQQRFALANLHIHCKNLAPFSSLRQRAA
jgi:hypothetical protein